MTRRAGATCAGASGSGADTGVRTLVARIAGFRVATGAATCSTTGLSGTRLFQAAWHAEQYHSLSLARQQSAKCTCALHSLQKRWDLSRIHFASTLQGKILFTQSGFHMAREMTGSKQRCSQVGFEHDTADMARPKKEHGSHDAWWHNRTQLSRLTHHDLHGDQQPAQLTKHGWHGQTNRHGICVYIYIYKRIYMYICIYKYMNT